MHWRASRAGCPPLIMIDDTINDDKMVEGRCKWGFVVYRTTYAPGTDDTWARMLAQLRGDAEEVLEATGRADLGPRHEIVAMDDKDRFEGATTHDVREHFRTWVADELPNNLTDEERGREEFSHAALARSESDAEPGPDWFLGTRWNFCLVVDDVCLESLDEMSLPVVKILWKQWGPLGPDERDYQVPEGWEDGQTDEEEEDVGWMYLSICEHVEMYEKLVEPEYWSDAYVRPPRMVDVEDEDELPGSWRKNNPILDTDY
ncbi:hypothetical protein KVR01_004035 [Diaporthe batatas]|uniref:uncharacterized protein n=1 Tax=Diaporthe batatas TaxID=748121 RepID=UPI001D041F5A|nr:uncharacterized protein KVR01_004035 [Diaporthe batatas]KAG8165483.1 hypothetical protein KVR01_004035 [Diaporthe batatas]